MKIYLDTSSINRIFDDQRQGRIYLEASSMLLIFALIENKKVDVVSSEILVFENAKNPYNERRLFVNAVLRKARFFQGVDERILDRSQEIEALGIKGLDALHLACAEESAIDSFITCDEKITKRYSGKLNVTNPIEFTINLLKGGDKI